MTTETISRIPGSFPLSEKNPAVDPVGSSTSLWITLLKRLLICPVTGPKSNENLRIVQFLGDPLFNNNNWIINSVQVRGAYQQPLNIPPGNWFDRDWCHRIARVRAAFRRSPPVRFAGDGGSCEPLVELRREAPWGILEEISPVVNGQRLEAAVAALWLVCRGDGVMKFHPPVQGESGYCRPGAFKAPGRVIRFFRTSFVNERLMRKAAWSMSD